MVFQCLPSETEHTFVLYYMNGERFHPQVMEGTRMMGIIKLLFREVLSLYESLEVFRWDQMACESQYRKHMVNGIK